MGSMQEQKCPACGAPLRFDAESGKLVCDYCGTVTEVKKGKRPVAAPTMAADETQMEGFDFSTLSEQAIQPDAHRLPVYNCVSCGAEVLAAPEQVALTCPYCGNNIVLTEKVSGALRPNGIIPFRIAAKDLPAAVRRYYKGKKLLPRGFFSESSIGPVTGVYVPFWVFDGRLDGTFTFNGTTSSSYRRGDYVITDTNHYDLVRQAVLCFDDLPVAASGKVDNKLMDSLEPFYTKEQVAFETGYLAGFTADRFDQRKQDISQRARERMANTASGIARSKSTAGYQNVRQKRGSVRATLDAQYVLFPVYLFQIKYRGRDYDFAVNGQTGKVVGNLPRDSAVSRNYFLLRFGLVAGALMLRSVVAYFMGV